jgi:hypothetical protein
MASMPHFEGREAVSIRQVVLIPHTHHDLGYTNSPRIVDRLHARIVGEVLRLAAVHDRPGAEQFRWTFEVARPVLKFVRTAGEEELDALRRLAAAGRVSVTGGYLNMTQLPSAAEFDAAYELLAELHAAGLPVRTEQHGDVNGIAWGTVEAMHRAGITRLVMALNPDHGRAPYEQPTGFWWEGVSGRRSFVWLSTHYGIGEEWGIVDGDTALAVDRIDDFVKQLEARTDYPYDTALVHAANDNRWPTARFLDVVRAWNEQRPDRPMRTATIDEALDVLEEQARRADVPVARGEWSDWWSHGHGSTAREIAVYRAARSFARAAQTTLALARLQPAAATPALAEVIGYRRGPVRLRDDAEVLADLGRVDEQLLLFGEHTWGSWETYSKPHSIFSHSHWNGKAAFGYEAYDLARDLAIEGMFRLAAGPSAQDVAGILAVNPSERERREPVEVEIDGRWRARTVVTVPAFGIAVAPVPQPPATEPGYEVALGHYRALVDPRRGGVVSLLDARTGRELVDGSVAHALGALVVEQVAPGARHPMLDENPKLFHPDHPGPPFARRPAVGDAVPTVWRGAGVAQISWRGSAPGVPEVTSTLTLYADLDVIDLDVAVVKPEHLGPESIFLAFPFAVRSPRFLLETAGAVYEAETEQLPDTSKDWYSIQHAVGVSDGERGVLWGSFDAPLVQLGGFHTGRWARHLDVHGGHVNSWLMNNLHFTNFQARQDGTGRYRYRFAPVDRPITRAEVRRYGRDLLEPVQARQYVGPARLGPSGLRVTPADRLLAEVRPVDGGAVRVRLRNPDPVPVSAVVGWDGPGTAQEQRVEVGGHEVADVVLSR